MAQQLADEKPQSQFGRTLGELWVEGRVERLFKTVQDRLVKELRLVGIVTIKAANQFVETWLPHFPPAQAA